MSDLFVYLFTLDILLCTHVCSQRLCSRDLNDEIYLVQRYIRVIKHI